MFRTAARTARYLSTTRVHRSAVQDAGGIIAGGDKPTKGRTGGGKDLDATAPGAPRPPKVSNFSTPGAPGEDKNLTEEQNKEVDEHNEEFERTHGHGGSAAAQVKVDEKFWKK